MSFDKEFVEKFQKCLSICKKILILKGCTELDCIERLESYLTDQRKSHLHKPEHRKATEDRSDESLTEIKERFKKLTSEFNGDYGNFHKDHWKTKQKQRTKEKTYSKEKTWNININVKVTTRETLMQAQAELKEKRKHNRENNEQKSEEGNAGTITTKEEDAKSKTDEKSEVSDIKKVGISHDSVKSKQSVRTNHKISPVKSQDSSRPGTTTNDLVKDDESPSRSGQNVESSKSKDSNRSQKQKLSLDESSNKVEHTKSKDSDSNKVEHAKSKDSERSNKKKAPSEEFSNLGMGLEELCLGQTRSEKSQNQSNISAKGSKIREPLKKTRSAHSESSREKINMRPLHSKEYSRENLKKSRSSRSKESFKEKSKRPMSSKSTDQSRGKRVHKSKVPSRDKRKIQPEVGEDAKLNKGDEQINAEEKDEPQEEYKDHERKPVFSPQLYSFTQTSKTSGVRLAMSPPFWLLVDHLLAVTWKLYSKNESNKRGLGIAQLQWAYEFLAVMKDNNNELKQPMNSVSTLLEDALINAYSKLGDINKKSGEKDDTDIENKVEMANTSPVEMVEKQWEPKEKQISYTLNDILIRTPTLQKQQSKDKKKGEKQIKKAEEKKTLEKEEVLKYLEHIKKEQRDRAYREKIHLEEIEEVIKLVQKDKFENETWRRSALKKEDKSKKRTHEDILTNEKSEVHFSA